MKDHTQYNPKVSIIIATLGRTMELDRVLNSVKNSTYKLVEVIIVDQNEDLSLASIIEKYSKILNIKYVRSSQKGVGINKNIGYEYCEGDIVTFSDDDSYYDIDTIEKAVMLLQNFDAISGRPWCPIINQKSLIRSPNEGAEINAFNYFNATIEFAMFWKKITLENVGLWDETLGVGGRWGSEGGADLVIRSLKKGAKIQYFSELIIFHENQLKKNKDKIYSYSKGHGAFMAKSILKEMNWRFLPYSITVITASLIKIPYYIIINDSYQVIVYKNRLKGIWKGFREYFIAFFNNDNSL